MKPNLFLTITFFTFPFVSYAQKSFNVTIKLDSSINPQNVRYQYYDGKNTTFVPDTFSNKRVIVLKDKFYSPFTSINISYTDSAKAFFDNDFFINDMPATISFYSKPNKGNKLVYTSIKNAVPIYDTAANKTWAKMVVFMTDTTVTKQNEAFDLFLTQHSGFIKNDSLTRVFNTFYKARLNRSMLFLKQYPDDYFSFWYFIQQVAQLSGALSRDTAYLKEQLAYLKTVFPAKYTDSIAGKALIKAYEAKIQPSVLKLNEAVPPFTITTIEGKKISLNQLKGKYVLLDFWATWCPPCLADMPFIKEIRKKYPLEKLVIIGVSLDHDSKKLEAFVKN